MKKTLFVSCLLIFGGFFSLAHAQSKTDIKLYMGETEVITVSNPTRIVIGNPVVFDVTQATRSEITLSPKSAGATTLAFWDDFGGQSYQVRVFAEKVQEIKRRVDNLLAQLKLPGVCTRADEDEGKVLLLGSVKNPQERERIGTALYSLKDKTIDLIEIKEEESVVEIDVQVLELNKDATNTLGLSWPGSISLIEKGSPGISSAGARGTLFHILNLQRGTDSSTANPFTLSLDVLIQEGKARVLSRPRLACQSGKEAELLVGGEKPIFTTEVSEGSSGTEVEYKEHGIKLKVRPDVTEGNRIKLALDVEVSEIGAAEYIGSTTSRTAQAYPLTVRNVSTELALDNGETLAIGGLIKDKSSEDIRKVPFLGDIPVVGALFRKKTSTIGGGQGSRENVELFIMLTPTIISRRGDSSSDEPSEAQRIKAPLEAQKLSSVPASLQGYASLVQKRILDSLVYPLSAREASFEGTVKLSLRLSYSGKLLDAAVKSSSGYKILDDNAINVARGITGYPPFPSSVEKEEIQIDIPIDYRLD